MKDASTQAKTEEIFLDFVSGSTSNPVARLKAIDDDGDSVILSDIENLNISKSGVDNRYNVFSLIPPSATFSSSVDNFASTYSPDTGNAFDGLLTRNRLYTPFLGYESCITTENLTSAQTFTAITDDEYHTQIISDKVFNDITSASTAPDVKGILFITYGDANYGSFNYQPEGYFKTDPIEIVNAGITSIKSLTITSDTTLIDVYLRSSNDSVDILQKDFVKIGSTSSGTSTITHTATTNIFVQYAFVWVTGEWSSTTGFIEDMIINFDQIGDLFNQGDYLGNDPSFSVSNGNYKASTSGSDFFRRALETNISTTAYTAAEMSTVIEDIADRCGIDHDTLTTTGVLVTVSADDTFKNTRAQSAFNECLVYLNAVDDDWRLRIDDTTNKLILEIKPTTEITADFQLDFRSNIISLNKSFQSTNVIQRATVLTESTPVGAEESLDSDNFTTVGQKTLTWTGEAIFKRFEIELNASDPSVTVVIDEVEGELARVTIAGSGSIDVDVEIFGDKLSGAGITGEAFSDINHQNMDGITQVFINRFVATDAVAKTLAEEIITLFGNQNFKYSITTPLNPLVELNDRLLVWEKFTNSQSILVVESINHSFTASGASAKTTISAVDIGFDFEDFVWDRHNFKNGGCTAGTDDIDYDTGLLWDQEFGPQVTSDTVTDVDTRRDVLFS
ncbi:hypothetical protein LCGC14_1679200 [marine sediment metagenome]|uniref:Uncharacterized protein n=1 Tax=marine sediment metagenome TaxID=412755 RepID=A0A0F9HPN5_9ZZZZ